MKKGVKDRIKTFAKNMGIHVSRVVHREETLKEALEEVAQDARRLTTYAVNPDAHERRKKALKYIERGRQFYNDKDYMAAEDMFLRAVQADGKCALAHTYLGHTFYKTQRMERAVLEWETAMRVEPDSEGAVKARRKLHHLLERRQKTIETLEQQIRDH